MGSGGAEASRAERRTCWQGGRQCQGKECNWGGGAMLGLLKRLVGEKVKDGRGAGGSEESGTHDASEITWHQVRVFFGGGPYVVVNRRSDRLGDLLGIGGDAIRAARHWTGADIVAITVDVCPMDTINALREQMGRGQRRSYQADALQSSQGEADVEAEDAGEGMATAGMAS